MIRNLIARLLLAAIIAGGIAAPLGGCATVQAWHNVDK
jgi:hypothetical protein